MIVSLCAGGEITPKRFGFPYCALRGYKGALDSAQTLGPPIPFAGALSPIRASQCASAFGDLLSSCDLSGPSDYSQLTSDIRNNHITEYVAFACYYHAPSHAFPRAALLPIMVLRVPYGLILPCQVVMLTDLWAVLPTLKCRYLQKMHRLCYSVAASSSSSSSVTKLLLLPPLLLSYHLGQHHGQGMDMREQASSRRRKPSWYENGVRSEGSATRPLRR